MVRMALCETLLLMNLKSVYVPEFIIQSLIAPLSIVQNSGLLCVRNAQSGGLLFRVVRC